MVLRLIQKSIVVAVLVLRAQIGFKTRLEHDEDETADVVPGCIRAFLYLSDVVLSQVCVEVVHCVTITRFTGGALKTTGILPKNSQKLRHQYRR